MPSTPTSPPPHLGEFEQLVMLAVLRLAPEAYALAIVHELEAEAGRAVKRGALYTTLDRLEAKSLIKWKVAVGGTERGDLPRRAYTVTPRGLAAVRASHGALARMTRGLEALLKEPSR